MLWYTKCVGLHTHTRTLAHTHTHNHSLSLSHTHTHQQTHTNIFVPYATEKKYIQITYANVHSYDMQKVALTADDEFVVVACDGVWDVMSNQEVTVRPHTLVA